MSRGDQLNREIIHNRSSIGSALGNYEVLPDVREVPFSGLPSTRGPRS